MRILVSACLLGVCCKYSGGHNACQAVQDLARTHCLIPVCPEQLGGLPTPRVPAERQGELVKDRDGRDVTACFSRGAEQAALLAVQLEVPCAVLKSRSPSCGVGRIYDGSFTGRLIPGSGVTAQKLAASGLPVFSEEELDDLARFLAQNEPKVYQKCTKSEPKVNQK